MIIDTIDINALHNKTKRHPVSILADIRKGKLKAEKIENKFYIKIEDANRYCAVLIFDNLHKRRK